MERVTSFAGVVSLLAEHRHMLETDFDVEKSLLEDVYLLEDKSLGLFQTEFPGVFSGHYMFTVRGEAAFDLAKRMLREMFRQYGAKVIIGLVPTKNRAACLLTRRLGFTGHGNVDLPGVGENEMFILTEKDFKWAA